MTWIFGVLIAVFAGLAALQTATPIPPEIWNDFAIASGIRPPEHPFPILWHQFGALLVRLFGIEFSCLILKILGPVSLGITSVVVMRIASRLLPGFLTRWAMRLRTGRLILNSFLFQCAAFFALSEPVFSSSFVFSPDSFRLLFFFLMIELAFRAVETFSVRRIIILAIVTAVVAVESILGILGFAFIAFYIDLCRKRASEAALREDTPKEVVGDALSRRFCVRHYSSVFFLSFALFFSLNVSFFSSRILIDKELFFIILDYPAFYLQTLVNGITTSGMSGVAIILMFVIIPFVYSLIAWGVATDVKKFMPMRATFFFALIAIILVPQSLCWDGAWFWSWLGVSHPICSPFVLNICLAITAITASMAVSAITIEFFFRSYERIERNFVFANEENESVLFEASKRNRVLSSRAVNVIFYCGFALLFSLLVVPKAIKLLPGHKSSVSEAAEIIYDAIRLTVDECGELRYLFTDGSLDVGVECYANSRGKKIKALSMAERKNDYTEALRTRDEKNEALKGALKIGAAEALRSWVLMADPVVSDIATQVGFELWLHNQKKLPQIGGIVARITPVKESLRKVFIERAIKLSNRILKLRGKGDFEGYMSPLRYTMFSHVQFRLSRIAKMRAIADSERGDIEGAKFNQELSEALEETNPEVKYIRTKMKRAARDSAMHLTPKEGLEVGFFLRNIQFSRFYAEQVLISDPHDFKANYAVAMANLAEREYVSAESYLRACLLSRPKDSFVLNNLAVTLSNIGRLDEAEEIAMKAIEYSPNTKEIQKTLEDIRKAKQKKKE